MSSQALKALAEPRRLEMLRLIRDRPHSASEIGRHFEITQQAVSQHLQVLAAAGLVAVQRSGKCRMYSLDQAGLQDLDRFLADLWPDGLQRLKRAVESEIDRP